jgi:hypothetical protein
MKPYSNNRNVVINVLGSVIVMLGLLRIVGDVSEIQFFDRVGYALAIAPLPSPFREVNGYENFSTVKTYEAILIGGESKIIDVNTLHRKNLKGPHRRKIVFWWSASGILWLPKTLTQPVFHYYFCDPKGFNITDFPQEKIGRVVVHIGTKTVGREHSSWEYTVECTKK